jgi:hypothetical protein
MVENDFVMVDPNAEGRKEEADLQKLRLNRQIEEAIYNIKPEDYNEDGELKEEGYVIIGGVIDKHFDEKSEIDNQPLPD